MPLQATSGAATYDAFGGGGATTAANYIEDMFQTWLYTGNGSTQTITNGVDLAGKGGLVWLKRRDAVSNHNLFDTARGATKKLYSDLTNAEFTDVTSLTSFNSNGFSLGLDGGGNANGGTYASWTFREQEKFFDVVTWTGNGSARTIAHNLGSVPGCIIIKCLNDTFDWVVWHRSFAAVNQNAFLNTTDAAGAYGVSSSTAPTSTVFSLTTSPYTNSNGKTYVAYLFAHDAGGFGLTGADNVISCGSYTGSSGSVNLGYEPQWIMVKRSDSTSDWRIIDNMRGWITGATLGSGNGILYPNLSNAELSGPGYYAAPTATGFDFDTGGGTWIYIAIRRGPMRTPTTGTSVFAPVAYTGNGTSYTISGLSNTPDLLMGGRRTGTTFLSFVDRLRGFKQVLLPSGTGAELTSASTEDVISMNNNNVVLGTVNNTTFNAAVTDIAWIASRAPGFFDVVCYTGNGSSQTVNHNLTVVPELVIFKVRSTTSSWWTTYNFSSNYQRMALDLTNAESAISYAPASEMTAAPTSSALSLGNTARVNGSGSTYVAYLFASCPGVSKVGSYTGTGTTQTINCGFTAGSRFVMIKRTDSTGDWYVWDSARGIVAGNDPYLLLNSTAAEVTSTDFVDTAATGFELSSTAPAALNANGGTYIFLAIA